MSGSVQEGFVVTREFDEFYRAEFAQLVGLAVVLSGGRVVAEDLVQDAMAEAYRRWDTVGAYESPRGWVRRVLVQRVAKNHRKRSNERAAQLRAVTSGVAVAPCGDGVDPEVLACVEALPAQQRAAVALFYLEDLPVREIAHELGLAEGTVKAHLSRGRAALASSLRAPADEGGL